MRGLTKGRGKSYKNLHWLVLIGLVGLTLTAGQATANTISIQDLPTITPSAGGFLWSYDVSHTNGVVAGGTSFGTGPDAGSFLTIYDFAGFTGFTSQPSEWVFVSNLLGVTPIGIGVVDDPGLPNLTWRYEGSNLTTALAALRDLGDFGAESIMGPGQASVGDYATRDRNLNLVNFSRSAGNVQVPAVPEPASLLLIGSGLAGLAAWQRRKLKKRD